MPKNPKEVNQIAVRIVDNLTLFRQDYFCKKYMAGPAKRLNVTYSPLWEM